MVGPRGLIPNSAAAARFVRDFPAVVLWLVQVTGATCPALRRIALGADFEHFDGDARDVEAYLEPLAAAAEAAALADGTLAAAAAAEANAAAAAEADAAVAASKRHQKSVCCCCD
jgi:type II secretory pathway component HofQ